MEAAAYQSDGGEHGKGTKGWGAGERQARETGAKGGSGRMKNIRGGECDLEGEGNRRIGRFRKRDEEARGGRKRNKGNRREERKWEKEERKRG